MEKGYQPLPVLNKITPDGSLCLVNYIINDSNIGALASTLKQIIPLVLKKIYLIDNSVKDK